MKSYGNPCHKHHCSCYLWVVFIYLLNLQKLGQFSLNCGEQGGNLVAVVAWMRGSKTVMLSKIGIQSHTQTPRDSLKNAWKTTQAKRVFTKAQNTHPEPSSWPWHCSWGLAQVRISAQISLLVQQEAAEAGSMALLGQRGSSGETQEIKILIS